MSSFLARRAAAAPAAFRAFSTSSPRSPTSTGHEVIKYSIASSSGPKENRHTSWFRVTKFIPEGNEKLRDFLLSIPKGSTVLVEGDVSVSNYQDSEGKNRTSLNIFQRSLDILKRPNTDAQQE
ncbi:unnamed protein product [Parascedosporium putredinis]|uniref:Nucleic acid-binding protein n=1 Tax=Parascedosporium putredinis TaxID=1442378 RepID=A0A9P1M7U3_9PEZI|nr:unnamed protein product [Parascedosporium putredinis]CAI7988620.1 unnamed protein product [Parascedosporium putredinis]